MAESQPPAQTPVIIPIATPIDLGGQITVYADMPCKWSVGSEGGAIDLVSTSQPSINFYSMDNSLDMQGKIEDVKKRFTDKPQSVTTIYCTNPIDNTKVGQTPITVNYKPFSKSVTSPNYEYSWFAQGGANWYVAKATCGGWGKLDSNDKIWFGKTENGSYTETTGQSAFPGLKEGGPPYTWHLPKKADYDALLSISKLVDEGQYWCGTWTDNNHCSALPITVYPGIAGIWLEEEQNALNGNRIVGSNLGVTSGYQKTSFPSPEPDWLGFRCVR